MRRRVPNLMSMRKKGHSEARVTGLVEDLRFKVLVSRFGV